MAKAMDSSVTFRRLTELVRRSGLRAQLGRDRLGGLRGTCRSLGSRRGACLPGGPPDPGGPGRRRPGVGMPGRETPGREPPARGIPARGVPARGEPARGAPDLAAPARPTDGGTPGRGPPGRRGLPGAWPRPAPGPGQLLFPPSDLTEWNPCRP